MGFSMTDFLKIKNLVALLAAESDDVRAMVRKELQACSRTLAAYLKEYEQDLPPEVLFELYDLKVVHETKKVQENWLNWLAYPNEYQRLEAAFTHLAGIEKISKEYGSVSKLLDDLTEMFLFSGYNRDVLNLNRFLFEEGRLKGALEDYYHPYHSNLAYAICEGKGLPITLVSIFMLCGFRLGLTIRGICLPGHFLAQTILDGKPLLIDCFNGGGILTSEEIKALNHTQQLVNTHSQTPNEIEIVTRVLVNLINAYYRLGSIEKYHLCGSLLSDLRTSNAQPQMKLISSSSTKPKFERGDIVHHKRYGYRGVIVDYDLSCEASDDWYYANRTQPNRNQPWYYVLVAGSEVSTYAAQSSLSPDPSGREVIHPLITTYFKGFDNGHYLRNNVPWQPH